MLVEFNTAAYTKRIQKCSVMLRYFYYAEQPKFEFFRV